MKKVSIIIAAYNAEKYIYESLVSVFSQDYDNLEVIVVNDGSEDKTGNILKQSQDHRLKVIHQENQGQCAALNIGIDVSEGEYIKFFDADDIMNSNHISSQINMLSGRTDLVSSCKWDYFYESPSEARFPIETTYKDYAKPMDWIVDSLTKDKGMMGAWLWLIPRQVLNKAGYWDTRLSLNNDFDFSIRVLLASKGVRFAENAKLYYRKGIFSSLTQSNHRQALESAFLTTKLGVQYILTYENSERTRRICADRWKGWLFEFYPGYKDLAKETEIYIDRLGGSDRQPDGGIIFRWLRQFLHWKQIRYLQFYAYKLGWGFVLRAKQWIKIRNNIRESKTHFS